MRRLFWLALGVTMGVLVMRKLSQAAQRLSPGGVAESIGSGLAELSHALRSFSEEVRDAMSEREAELRAGTGLDGTLGRAESA